MIEKITKLKELGIFADFNADSDLKIFSKFNLFYGWNGSGKTTLSKFFYSLQKDETLPVDLISSEFEIRINENNLSHKDSIQMENLNVFNEDFIKSNIDWDNKVESILLVSKSKISEKEKLDKKRNEQKEKKKVFDEKNSKITELNNSIDKEFSKKAKEIKTSFQSISPNDKTYFNYNKSKLKSFIEVQETSILEKTGKLQEQDLLKLIEQIKPNEKNIVDFSFKIFNIESLQEAELKIENLLKIGLSEGVINRLKENSDIAEWIEKGLEIHKKHGEEKCEFCGNEIGIEHLDKLKKHFSDELNLLRNKIEKAKEWIEENLVIEELNIEKELFYKDLERNFLDAKNNLITEKELLNNFFIKWKELLE